MAASMTAKVSSREWPSIKTSSVDRPIRGTRAKISAMLPALLRAGTMTETDAACSDDAGWGRGRATITLVRAKYLNGQSFTR